MNTLDEVTVYIRENCSRSPTLADLNRYAKLILNTCPASGKGVHYWLFQAARLFHKKPFRLKAEKICELLESATANCGRALEPHEIPDAVSNSDEESLIPPHLTVKPRESRPRGLPPPKGEIIEEAIRRSKLTLRDLIDASPLGGTERFQPLDALERLFPEKPLLCLAWDKYRDCVAVRWNDPRITRRRPYPPLMIPSPLLGKKGRTRGGKLSARALSNVGKRKYLVIEWDKNGEGRPYTVDEQVRLIWFLANSRWIEEIVMVLFSGKASLHSWVKVDQLDEKEIWAICCFARELGADPQAFGKAQLIRTPGAVRPETGKQQTVYYMKGESHEDARD